MLHQPSTQYLQQALISLPLLGYEDSPCANMSTWRDEALPYRENIILGGHDSLC
jgi:hypothetical protein